MMLLNIGTGLAAFAVLAVALENYELAAISFGLAVWCMA
jgi:hypothetical protein